MPRRTTSSSSEADPGSRSSTARRATGRSGSRGGEASAGAKHTAAVEVLRIRGAKVHNLKNLDLDIPRDQFVVITGLSGSGKSSLAFDTIYAEGQRQYIESLSTYARQFLNQLERPEVDLIDGLQPTVAIDQRPGSHNPRSTVATVTEIYDYLRLLLARVGVPHCPQCDQPIRHQNSQQIVDSLLALPEGTKLMLLAPKVRGRKGEHRDVIEAIRKGGFVRVRVDGEIYDLDAVPELVRQRNHSIEAVVDRIIIRPGIRDRLAESIELTLKQGNNALIACAQLDGKWTDRLFSTEFACPTCEISFDELEPRSFSFNSPYGACRACEGMGTRYEFDREQVIPERGLSLAAGAVAPWRDLSAAVLRRYRKQLTPFLESIGAQWQTPLSELKPRQWERLLEGDDKSSPGIIPLLQTEYELADDERQQRLDAFRDWVTCPECGGSRLRPEARSVRLAGRAIHELTALGVDTAAEWFAELKLEGDSAAIGQPLVEEIAGRLRFLQKVGLGYLTLDRRADSLSGGESQRIRLAAGIGSGLVGVCYVLDEPSIGLHPRDNDRLIAALQQLQQLGNSVLVVEHDETIMQVADHLIDMGPGAGRQGGEIVAAGTPAEVMANPASLTGQYLTGQRQIPLPAQRRKVSPKRGITLSGATANNLKNVTARFPLGALVCVTGVSGSGKSSLLGETFSRAVQRELGGVAPRPGAYGSLTGVERIDKFVQVDQSPIGRTPRSNPATYTGVFDEIRKVFVTTREARLRGYKPGRFSFNTKGGRCEECQGQGTKRIEMNFLPDLYVPCEVCGGKRFNRQTLEVKYRDRSIADVLEMRVDEGIDFFENFPQIARVMQSLHDVGLGYITLGQSSTTLSGGEAQRIKLATELARVNTGNTLYVLDEPTTGLHFEDIRNLLTVLGRLVDLGNTVIVIEHNLDVIKSADWILDLGPEGGQAGGQIVAQGTPEEVAESQISHTGRYLRQLLKKAE